MVVPRAVEVMMFRVDEALPVLQRTPGALRALLQDLPDAWTSATEGPNTWSPFDVVGHLIHADRTDWVPRVKHILRHGDAVPFPAFDREAMFAASSGLSLTELLDTFDRLRKDSLARLAELELTDADLARSGLHPQFGAVTLDQHLATWVAHDLGHVSQVVRVMARQYTDAVGPCARTYPCWAVRRNDAQMLKAGDVPISLTSDDGASVATSLRSQW